MIVDVHGHVGPWFFSTGAASAADNIRRMDAHGIDVQLVSSVEAVVYDPVSGNRALVDEISSEPRLKGLLVVDPRELEVAAREMSGLLATGLFVGAKIHTDYTSTPAGSSAMAAALRMLTAHRLPVLVHTWGAEIVGLAENVASIPDARVIAAHMGGPDWRLVPDAAARTDRLWFEPCYSIAEAGRVRWVLDRVGPQQFMFGSDSTLIDPAVTLGAVRAARLSPDEERLLMWENAVDVFGLT